MANHGLKVLDILARSVVSSACHNLFQVLVTIRLVPYYNMLKNETRNAEVFPHPSFSRINQNYLLGELYQSVASLPLLSTHFT